MISLESEYQAQNILRFKMRGALTLLLDIASIMPSSCNKGISSHIGTSLPF